MPMTSLSRDDIVNAVSQNAFAAARSYWSRGHVLTVSASPDRARVTAKVQGSRRRPYAQDIRLQPGRRGVTVEGFCTCPVGFNCKHVAAALLAFLDSGRS